MSRHRICLCGSSREARARGRMREDRLVRRIALLVAGTIVVTSFGSTPSAAATSVKASTVDSVGSTVSGLGIHVSNFIVPPGGTIGINGAGYTPLGTVDLFIDTGLQTTLRANAVGAWSATLKVPSWTRPGTHWISAVDRDAGLMAQYGLWVRDDWPMFGYDPAHTGWNKAENVISPANVGRLALEWRVSWACSATPRPLSPATSSMLDRRTASCMRSTSTVPGRGAHAPHCGPARPAA